MAKRKMRVDLALQQAGKITLPKELLRHRKAKKGLGKSSLRPKYCSCGNPQSFPIPHEHDWTERERQIIRYLADEHGANEF